VLGGENAVSSYRNFAVDYLFGGGEGPLMTNAYDALAQAVCAAGFYTNGIEDHGTWQRTCVCSKKRNGGGFTGNSFWVSRLPSGWYLGTWGECIYRLPDDNRLAELCIKWLSRVPDETRADFDEPLKLEFGLAPVPEELFFREAGVAEPSAAEDDGRGDGS